MHKDSSHWKYQFVHSSDPIYLVEITELQLFSQVPFALEWQQVPLGQNPSSSRT